MNGLARIVLEQEIATAMITQLLSVLCNTRPTIHRGRHLLAHLHHRGFAEANPLFDVDSVGFVGGAHGRAS